MEHALEAAQFIAVCFFRLLEINSAFVVPFGRPRFFSWFTSKM
jgi:hypothetical protein